ncbi:MAG: RNA polymerase sigma factor [Gemmatimonadaceae bacterium]|nr:RNA polymerase sigma factor [Gemmatimonadaceae bacterium]
MAVPVLIKADIGAHLHQPEVSPDVAIVARIRRGDTAAIGLLYERHAERVYETAWRILRNRSDAEQATQDVFIRALPSLHQLRDVSTIGAWLCAIAARAAYDLLRVQKRDARRLVPLDQADAAPAAPSPDPLLGDHLRQAIATLSSKLQIVLVMYEIEGHSHAEIASVLGIPEATSKTRLSQARAQLRQLLAPYAKTENSNG